MASRPHPLFRNSFGRDDQWSVNVPDLTRNDIKRYIRYTLEADELFRDISKDDDRYQALVTEIVDNAKGVFLWVTLVVRSLLGGMSESDSLKMLQKRVRELPSDMNKLYQRLLEGIDPVYKAQACNIFRFTLSLVDNSATVNSILLYHYLLEEEGSPFDTETSVRPVSPGQCAIRYNEISRAMQKTCRGLVRTYRARLDDCTWHRDLFCAPNFIHRSVSDYLRKNPSIPDYLIIAGNETSVGSFMCQASMALLKTLPWDYEHLHDRMKYIN